MLMTGSIHIQPLILIIIPEITTPTDTTVSANMCKKAPRIFKSCFLCLISNIVVNPLMIIPAAAVQLTAIPDTGTEFLNLYILSITIAPTATNRMTLFNKDIRTVAFL